MVNVVQKEGLESGYEYWEKKVEDEGRYKDIVDRLNQIINKLEMGMRKTRSKVNKAVYDIMIELLNEVVDVINRSVNEIKRVGIYGEGMAMVYEAKRLVWLVSELMAKYGIREDGVEKEVENVWWKLSDLYEDLKHFKLYRMSLNMRF